MKNMPDSLSHVSNKVDGVLTDENLLCPACFAPRKSTDIECCQCGVIFSQYTKWAREKRTKHTIGGLYHLSIEDIDGLEMLWTKIENAYLDQDLHNRFIHRCLALKSLPFAAFKYQQQLRKSPEDDLARYQLEKVMTLVREWFAPEKPVSYVLGSSTLWRWLIALSILGWVVGILALFAGMLTSTPSYYLAFGGGIVIVSSFIYIYMRRLLTNS
ncbi:MAG: hypothetical protein H6623_03825 [Bdellovibrionaceae bacterium]|nr:hypothetical protein [Pseudobdellovibrionaceae bacterium]